MQLQFKDITLDSKSTIESYTKQWNSENAEMSFAHMFMWGDNGKIQYAEDNDILYIKLDFPEETTFMFPPIPKYNNADYSKAICKASCYLKSIGVEPCLKSVSAPFDTMIKNSCPDIVLTEAPWNFDYVYLSENLITLKGKKFHAKRNHINKITSLYPDYVYENLNSSMVDECMELYDSWNVKHDEHTIDQYDERGSVVRAIKYMDKIGLTGGCIRIDGKMKAFTLGEKILPNMCQVHIEKADNDIDGLYPLINQEYAAHRCAEVMFINREEDMGLDGLRQAKKSYRPVRMVEKYNAALTDKLKCEEKVLQTTVCV